MKPYQSFSFDSCGIALESGLVTLRYSFKAEDGSALHFEETLRIKTTPVVGSRMDRDKLDAALRALHLAGGVSYYKTCLPKIIDVKSQALSQEQAKFWNTVYEKGLGEFFYKNKIDFRNLIHFPISPLPKFPPDQGNREIGNSGSRKKKILVPIGGGKDSVVTVEKLKEEGADITLLRMGSHPAISLLVDRMKLPCITVERHLDPQLFSLNAEGALNSHIPITAYLSCVCAVVAEYLDFDAIAMSMEKSANEGNVEYLGTEINHQWSKSEEFEEMFQDYIHHYIDPDLRYCSPLRDMRELEIVGEFAKFPEYFDCTTSCNKNWKIIRDKTVDARVLWCGECPKCAFVFALMAAHLPKETVLKIFKKDLFADENLIPLYRELLGMEGFKPFECVGTPEETREAFAMIRKRGEFRDSPILKLL